jgi:hypothetical protein
MKSYVVELRLPTGDATELAAAGERARTAAEQLSREGTAVRWVRSVYLPEEETCLLVFEAPTPEAVDRAGRRAALTYARIVEGGRHMNADRKTLDLARGSYMPGPPAGVLRPPSDGGEPCSSAEHHDVSDRGKGTR